jgi:putative PIG3 family NAD(P)H quinone oxidoreductase
MRAMMVENPGRESRLRVGEVPAPVLGPADLRLRVEAAGVNRADLMQRMGFYPPPPGASPLLGLECAGTVTEVGGEVRGWRPGERAMALLTGGGYAEDVVVPAACALRAPDALSWEEAAALPEVFLTVHLNLFELGRLPEGGTALVHGGGSGIGTAAIRLVRATGSRIVVTAGSDAKCARCRELGADEAVNYRSGDFVAATREASGGRGADVVLDHIGAPYLERNLEALAVGGRLVLIGLMGGARAELDLGRLLVRRLSVIGSTLRARPVEEKGRIVAGFLERFGELLERGELRPVVDRVLPLERADEAHRAMRASEHFGKIVLRVRSG